MGEPFPVLEEQILAPAPRSRLGVRRRDLDDLPVRRPGTTLVFDVDGAYRVRPVHGPLRPNEHHVVVATAVALVDMRPRTVEVEFPVASPDPAADFSARISFLCRVLDAAAVAQQGLSDLAPLLLGHLGQDQRMRWLATEFDATRMPEAARQVHRRIIAQLALAPPDIPGLAIQVVQVEIRMEGTGL
ncbi:hypothetical protein F4553_002977 [Allocatelliglobosispora scoriae]|uniref:Band 7 domain-containing protein n=1 Tax=Allocatelliglobosispora scoriae TaxID=643052 RepID=A0A841BQE0_9ACTN|nr:hypothetical protein [Allocatelliglobosispora scoriae]MBB5869598.1 hypothetical protein [Allocatelliglobosispora scoriae]